MAPSHGRRLVAGYDGSPAARCAVAVAARRAGPRGTVCVVHAYRPPPERYDILDRDRWHADHRERAQALLDTVLLTGDDELLDTNYETVLVPGPTAAALAGVATATDADEIVVGARGLGPVRSLLGSVSHELLTIADRPVLVIPARAVDRIAHRPAA
jgi:nucleotide-binding universal stress UspA family protein